MAEDIKSGDDSGKGRLSFIEILLLYEGRY
jgi:hypothetical protein